MCFILIAKHKCHMCISGKPQHFCVFYIVLFGDMFGAHSHCCLVFALQYPGITWQTNHVATTGIYVFAFWSLCYFLCLVEYDSYYCLR